MINKVQFGVQNFLLFMNFFLGTKNSTELSLNNSLLLMECISFAFSSKVFIPFSGSRVNMYVFIQTGTCLRMKGTLQIFKVLYVF